MQLYDFVMKNGDRFGAYPGKPPASNLADNASAELQTRGMAWPSIACSRTSLRAGGDLDHDPHLCRGVPELGVSDRDQSETNVVAKTVIEFAQRGARDPIRLRDCVLQALRRLARRLADQGRAARQCGP